MNLGIFCITRAELRAVVIGLQLAWERVYRKVRVQLDSQAAIQLLLVEREITHQYSSEVLSFHEMLERDWVVKVEHIYRECNRPADLLDGLGHKLPIDVHQICTTDPTLSLHLLYDSFEISQPRLIVNEGKT
ncbi:Putative ribonuclease H protein At1g65750 [Linum grandiflorum]